MLALDVEKLLAEEATERQVAVAGTRPNSLVKDDTLPKFLGKVESGDAETPSLFRNLTNGDANANKATAQAAAIVGTNRQYLSYAKKIAAQAPELLEEVQAGEKSITDAKRELKERQHKQMVAVRHKLVFDTAYQGY